MTNEENNKKLMVKQYQESIKNKLKIIFPGVEIKKEWASFQGEGFKYSPRVDVAVGPLAIGNKKFGNCYNTYLDTKRYFIECLIDNHLNNILNYDDEIPRLEYAKLYDFNYNARCFLAIEIENQTDQKYVMGSILNASALGKIGILVAYNESMLQMMIRIRKYIGFLLDKKGGRFDITNLLILDDSQLLKAISGNKY